MIIDLLTNKQVQAQDILIAYDEDSGKLAHHLVIIALDGRYSAINLDSGKLWTKTFKYTSDMILSLEQDGNTVQIVTGEEVSISRV